MLIYAIYKGIYTIYVLYICYITKSSHFVNIYDSAISAISAGGNQKFQIQGGTSQGGERKFCDFAWGGTRPQRTLWSPTFIPKIRKIVGVVKAGRLSKTDINTVGIL